jgi:hypothetical protein
MLVQRPLGDSLRHKGGDVNRSKYYSQSKEGIEKGRGGEPTPKGGTRELLWGSCP